MTSSPPSLQPGQVVSKDVETNIKLWIGAIDQKLTAQLNEILHTPAFQKLEGTWRGCTTWSTRARPARTSRSAC